MIQETITYTCHSCDSINIVKNGTNKCGNQQYHCKDCGVYRVLKQQTSRVPEAEKQKALQAYRERVSLRGLERIFGVCRKSVMQWLATEVDQLPSLAETVLPPTAEDVLELDEAWSFVGRQEEKRWLWTALCRRTRQIVAFVIGDRSEATCRRLWQQLPLAYRHCRSFSDFWQAYQAVWPAETHQPVAKESGETAHMERWYNTLRQWLGRYTRKTLSFSKSDFYHKLVTRWFIIHYNLQLLPSSLT
jgi:IS1 family transposase/transposase-like protein